MTKHLAGARVEELLSKLGVRLCARGRVVAFLVASVEANHFDGRTDHAATLSCAHGAQARTTQQRCEAGDIAQLS